MGPFEMVAIIVVVSVGASTLQTWIKSRDKQLKYKADPNVDAKLQALEERVQVLEELVTDQKHRLRSEFDQLK